MSRVLTNSENRITQSFSTSHPAVDLGFSPIEANNIVKAHSAGIITELVDGKDNNKGSTGLASYGNYILIDHGNGYKTRYAHLKKNTFTVSKGQSVNTNTNLATMGESGNAYGRHLHFEVYKGLTRINPKPYLTSDFPPNTILNYQAHDKTHNWNSNVLITSNPGVKTNEYAGWLGFPIDAIFIDNYKYRVHDMTTNKWTEWSTGRNNYAGVMGHNIDGIQIEDVEYRAHIKGGNWLSWVSKVDDTSNGYAGIYGKAIDAFQIRLKNN